MTSYEKLIITKTYIEIKEKFQIDKHQESESKW